MTSTQQITDWEKSGKYFRHNDHKLFFVDNGNKGYPPLIFLHGYPTCSFDYKDIIATMKQNFRIIIPDFLGFGLSDKPKNHQYLLTDQADAIENLCRHLDIERAHIIAHNYGTSVATELIYRHNHQNLHFNIKSVTLCNGSMLIDMSQLRPIQKMLKHRLFGPVVARFSNRNTFHRNMKNIWYNKSKYNMEEMEPLWDLLTMNDGKSILPKITRYIDQRFQNYERWIGALKLTDLSIHILWAENDPVAIVGMAHKLESLIPNNTKTIIPECGHYPMIEAPGQWVDLLLSWINKHV